MLIIRSVVIALFGALLFAGITALGLSGNSPSGEGLYIVVIMPAQAMRHILGLDPKHPGTIADTDSFLICMNAILGGMLFGVMALIRASIRKQRS
jgi:hypothetical protein